MEKKYYLLKSYYMIAEWDCVEENPIKVVFSTAPRTYNLGTFIGQFKSKTDAWQHLMSQLDVSDFLAERGCLSLDEWYLKKKEQRLKEADLRVSRHKENYEKLVSQYEVIPTTPETISIVLAYLRYVNWGGWDLPKMSIGYCCAQYDCDGKTAVTMILDQPIDYYGELVSKFVKGAPVGHLMKYHRI